MARFLVFEGLDGSGKSSLMGWLEKELKARGVPYCSTREPGGTWLGEELRRLILDKTTEAPCTRAELLLYEASRAQHVDRVIRPRLQQGEWVLCDRFEASSVAFQAGGRSIPGSDVEWLNAFATAGLKADLTVLLDVPTDEAKRRRRHRSGGDGEDRIESEAEAFHERVRASFLEQARRDPKSWIVLSGFQTVEELGRQLMQSLRERQWLDG